MPKSSETTDTSSAKPLIKSGTESTRDKAASLTGSTSGIDEGYSNRDSTAVDLTPEEIAAQVASLRTVGGVYNHVADWVEYDNLTAPLTPAQLESLGRYGVTADALNLERTTP